MAENTFAKSEDGIRFGKGTLALGLSGILVKILGMLYKIPLANLLGDEGMGYFNAAYTVYTLFFVLATAGLPVALSLLVADASAKGEGGRAEGIYRVAERLFLAVGLILALAMAIPSKGIAGLLGSEKAHLGILAVAPAIFFMSYASAMRGYFQGLRLMTPLAVSQLVEAAGKFIIGLLLIFLTLDSHPLSTVAAYGILGLTFATFFAMLYLMLARYIHRKKTATCQAVYVESAPLKRKLLGLAFPVTLSALVTTLASSLDLFLILRMLRAQGYTAEEASAAYGNYSALAVPLFNMPTVLILPIAYSVLPYVRGALAQGNREGAKGASLRALKMTAILSIPASVGMSLLAKPILSLLFTDEAAVLRAAPLLSILSLAIFPLAMLTVTATLLQAYGKLWFPIGATFVGIGVKLFVTLWGMPRVGIAATPFGTFLCYSLVAALTLGYLACQMGGFSPLRLLLKPVAATLFMVPVPLFLYPVLASRMPSSFATLVTLAFSVTVYLTVTALLKGIGREDLLSLGVPRKITVLLEKLRILS